MPIEIDHRKRTNRETLAEAFRIEKILAKQAAGKALWELGELALDYELVDPNNYLQEVTNRLSKGVGVLVGINHITMKEPVLALQLISDKIAPLNRTVGVSALKYFDKRRFPGVLFYPIASATTAYTGLD